MRTISAVVFLLHSFICFSQSYPDPLVSDSFQNTSQFVDLSTRLLWGSSSLPQSAFRLISKTDGAGLGFNALNQTDSARKYSGYQAANSIKASMAIDYRFPVFDRTNDSLQIEFDVLWDTLVSGGNTGRIVAALMHDYPAEIPFNTVLDSVDAVAPFGRPAYSFRVLNRIPQGTNNYANMMYGGGRDSLGEFERYNSAGNRWWLPGFISGPGGVSPESNSPEYPLSGVVRWRNYTIASRSRWRHFTWKVAPEKIEVWVRNTQTPAGNDTLVMRMVVPKPGPIQEMLTKMQLGHGLSQALDSLPILYHWPRFVNGFRLYMAGANSTNFANISVKGSSGGIASKRKPNPAQDVVMIPNPARNSLKLGNLMETAEYEIVNTAGKTVASGSVSNLQPIELINLASGIYTLKLVIQNQLAHHRFVKE